MFQKANKEDPCIEVMWLEVDDVPQPSSQAELYAANMIVEDIVNGMSFCARKFYCTVRLTVLQWVLGYCTVRPLEALGASDGWLSLSDGWGYLH